MDWTTETGLELDNGNFPIYYAYLVQQRKSAPKIKHAVTQRSDPKLTTQTDSGKICLYISMLESSNKSVLIWLGRSTDFLLHWWPAELGSFFLKFEGLNFPWKWKEIVSCCCLRTQGRVSHSRSNLVVPEESSYVTACTSATNTNYTINTIRNSAHRSIYSVKCTTGTAVLRDKGSAFHMLKSASRE